MRALDVEKTDSSTHFHVGNKAAVYYNKNVVKSPQYCLCNFICKGSTIMLLDGQTSNRYI